MKTSTYIKSKGGSVKFAALRGAHNRKVRHDKKTFVIKVATLGAQLLANAEQLDGNGTLINLFDSQNETAVAIRKLIEQGVYS